MTNFWREEKEMKSKISKWPLKMLITSKLAGEWGMGRILWEVVRISVHKELESFNRFPSWPAYYQIIVVCVCDKIVQEMQLYFVTIF